MGVAATEEAEEIAAEPSTLNLKQYSVANVSPHGPAGDPEGPYGTKVDSHYFVGHIRWNMLLPVYTRGQRCAKSAVQT